MTRKISIKTQEQHPTVTGVETPVVSDDRSSISVSWTGEGAQIDGKYRVEVSENDGAYTELDTTADTAYTYKRFQNQVRISSELQVSAEKLLLIQ